MPEGDQVGLREGIDEGLRLEEGTMPDIEAQGLRAGQQAQAYADYIEWPADNTSDDLLTPLHHNEFDELGRQTRGITRTAIHKYIQLTADHGHDTLTRLMNYARMH